MLPLRAMVTKVLLTIAVLLLAWLAIRARLRAEARGTAPAARPEPLVPVWALRVLAYALVSTMIAGTGIYLWRDWATGREPISVRVVNSNTGEGVTYRARRADVSARSFLTLDGRRISLADIERMELEERTPR